MLRIDQYYYNLGFQSGVKRNMPLEPSCVSIVMSMHADDDKSKVNSMKIRKAFREDGPVIATCLFLAMEGIIYEFIGIEDKQEAFGFMEYLVDGDDNQYSYQNCWVAEINDKVVGAVAVYDGARLGELRGPVERYISNRYKRSFHPEDETEGGEFYIDSLGVDPAEQGRGIGAKLLQFLIEEYVGRRGETLGLLVDKENPGARKLYLRLGFEVVGEKELAGKKMEHLQVRELIVES
jgi:ribosomal protein S18 acetylase RimI-like enzyme